MPELAPCLCPSSRVAPWDVYPFSEREALEVRDRLNEIAKRSGKDPHLIANRWWPVIRQAADACALHLKFESLRKSDPNATRPLRRALRRVTNTGKLPRNVDHHDALEYGARRAGLNNPIDQLSPIELRAAAQAAMVHGPVNDQPPGNRRNIIFDAGGREAKILFSRRQPYPAVLAHIYRRIAGKKPGYSTDNVGHTRRGPAVRYFQACLAPLHPRPSPDIVRRMIKSF